MSAISLNMIVKNEEKFLAGSLESVKDLVDEIIIADTGSDDNTIEIAKKYNAKLYYYTWKNDFADARNFVLQKSTCEWILYLDADERIQKIYHPLIKDFISNPEIDAVLLKLKSVFSTGTHEQIQIVPYPRLFRNIKGLAFSGRIHEQITPSLVKAGAKFQESNIIIDHLGYNQEDEVIEQKKNRNLQSLIQIVQEEPENAYAQFQLGQNYVMLKEKEKGIGYLKKSLDLGTLNPGVSAAAFSSVAQYHNEIGDFKNAEIFCKKSLHFAPNQLFANLLLGEIFSNSNRFPESLKYYNLALEYIQIPENLRKAESAVDVSYNASFVYYKIGIVYLKQGSMKQAEESFLKSYTNDEKFNPALIELGNINFQMKKYDVALQYLRKVNINDIKDTGLLMNIAGLFEEMNEFKDCADVLEYVIGIDPENAKAYFFLGSSYLAMNDLEKSFRFFLKSHELAPEVTETIQNLAVIHIKQNNFKGALSEFLKLEKLLPEDTNIQRKIVALKKKIELN
jgi:tetratricopeptide (TPR) repeat protein